MTGRVELERTFASVQRLPHRLEPWLLAARVHTDAGQYPGEILHILLRVPAVDTQCVQLHQLTRVVFIDVPGRIVCVVQIFEHGRMAQRCQYQLTKET